MTDSVQLLQYKHINNNFQTILTFLGNLSGVSKAKIATTMHTKSTLDAVLEDKVGT